MAASIVVGIRIFPIKGLDAVEVSESSVLPSGALRFDRQWAFMDSRGGLINGKNRAEIHTIRTEYRLEQEEALLDGRVYSLARQRADVEKWMSDRMNERVELQENRELGFPDDAIAPGPTFVGRESLEVVAGWYTLPLAEARRFRTNIEFQGAGAFWEDRLYGSTFKAGPVEVRAINPCRRCVVPSRDSQTGEEDVAFQKRFSMLRKAHLPEAADPSFFKDHYRLAVNTRVAASEAGKTIRVGDPIVFPM